MMIIIRVTTVSQVLMMMTNLDDVLVSDIRNLGLDMKERFLHSDKVLHDHSYMLVHQNPNLTKPKLYHGLIYQSSPILP